MNKVDNSLNLDIVIYGSNHFKNFRRLCYKLAKQGNVDKLKSFKVIENGCKRKLADCPENTLILECIKIARQVKLQQKYDRQAIPIVPFAVKGYGERKFYGIKHNL